MRRDLASASFRCCGRRSRTRPREGQGALAAAAEGLDPSTAWWAASPQQRVRATGLHHGGIPAGPRRYLARSDDVVTLFDGLPVGTDSGIRGTDASELDRAWDGLADRLDGQFCAVRLDLHAETVEVLTDTLGFVPVYCARHQGGFVISNSATAIATLLGLHAPDPLGVSTFLGLGWAASDRTTVAGVRHSLRRLAAPDRRRAARDRAKVRTGAARLAETTA